MMTVPLLAVLEPLRDELLLLQHADDLVRNFFRRACPRNLFLVGRRREDAADLRRRTVQTIVFLVLIVHILEREHRDFLIFRRLLLEVRRQTRLHDILLHRDEAGELNLQMLDMLAR